MQGLKASTLRPPMSALGQEQTFAAQEVMSALPSKADMCGAAKDVRFGPKADIGRRGPKAVMCSAWSMSALGPRTLLDDAVSAQQNQRRNRKAKRLCRSHVKHGFKLGSAINWKIGWFDPSKNFVHKQSRSPAHIVKISTVGN